ncbi:cyclic diguanylate phosphodiesterase (EAL) domain protein [Leptospira fainei serovar Hurstbridge str. BUT 6]|uniref:Cyclic diguanylate phosphodiesterase (EAL) domain protein n=1 Tax=Leptospira fainei serovar Hurstbridge str. BUT 6 TaxID=1193011 RepID=S3VEW5_9LEPT|nr:EAL domain-containing protein [Leptospira fainei]EPG75010.1 cyclic diguanylate phosphodiesterase (EAL) domain protein [Leptospira fainei serovar Hurstbridge str. BUT 6]
MNLAKILQPEVAPFFQPILSVEDGSIFGHEVLARVKTDQGWESGGYLFSNGSGLSDQDVSTLEASIWQSSMRKIQGSRNKHHLFLNISPNRLYRELKNERIDSFRLLRFAREFEIEPKQIILEITEEEFAGSLDSLRIAVDLLRAYGFRIALDDLGSEASGIERVGLLRPDFLKMDLRLIRASTRSPSVRKVMEHIRDLAFSLGASVLYEGLETQEEMYFALEGGARFLQGYLLQRPSPELSNNQNTPSLIKEMVNFFHEKKTEQISVEIAFEKKIQNLLREILSPFPIIKIASRYMIDAYTIFIASKEIHRAYVTDSKGTQLSPYYVRTGEDSFRENSQGIGKNWSYLPYFYKQLRDSFRKPEDWGVSDRYYDNEAVKDLIVFSKEVEPGVYVFLDISAPKIL